MIIKLLKPEGIQTVTFWDFVTYLFVFCYLKVENILKKRLSFLTDRSSINNRSFINEIITVIF